MLLDLRANPGYSQQFWNSLTELVALPRCALGHVKEYRGPDGWLRCRTCHNAASRRYNARRRVIRTTWRCGHPKTPENTLAWSDHARCRACVLERQRKRVRRAA